MRRDRPAKPAILITAYLKLAVVKFGPPKDWDQRVVTAWIKQQMHGDDEPFDPRQAQTGERNE